VFFHSGERVLSLKMIYLFIAELHLAVIRFSTGFYVLYFTSYLAILQKLFESELKEYNSQRIIFTEKLLAEIKFKLDSIQSLIEKISNLLSPMLLFTCGAIFYDLVTCLYFTIKSIEVSAFFKSGYSTPNFGIFFNILRLICICLFAERLVFQVLLKYFFLINFKWIENFQNKKIFEEMDKFSNFIDSNTMTKVCKFFKYEKFLPICRKINFQKCFQIFIIFCYLRSF
jgi:hypothetical protein